MVSHKFAVLAGTETGNIDSRLYQRLQLRLYMIRGAGALQVRSSSMKCGGLI